MRSPWFPLPDRAAATQEITKQRVDEKARIKNLIAYGSNPIMAIGGGLSQSDTPVSPTSPMPKGGGGNGFLGKMKDFFNGK